MKKIPKFGNLSIFKKMMLGTILFCSLFFSCSQSDINSDNPSTITDTNSKDAISATSPVGKYGQISVSGRYMKDKNGNTMMLRGQSFGWSSWWPQYWNTNVVSWMATDFKVDVLRASMGVDASPGYLTGDQTNQTNLVKTVVNAAINNGLYVIIDWHCEAFHQSEAVAFFKTMAQTYGSNPNVIYEILNEPNNTQTWAQCKSYAQAVIAGIRQYDPDNIIIVGCPNWDQKIRDVADSPLSGYSNIMYTVHYYAATHGQWLRDDCTYAYNKGIPIFITECNGSEASGSGHFDYTQWNAWMNFCDAQKISWVNWSISDKAGELCSIVYPGASANGGWSTSTLTESGNFIRTKLRSYDNGGGGGGGTGGIVSGATYIITARHSGKVLDVSGAGTANGTNVHQWTNYGNSNQKWIVTDIGSGYYKLSPAHAPGKSLDVSGASTADGGNVQIWDSFTVPQQQWQIADQGNGYYHLIARNSGKCLNISGASTVDGGKAQIWSCASVTNQDYSFTKQ